MMWKFNFLISDPSSFLAIGENTAELTSTGHFIPSLRWHAWSLMARAHIAGISLL